jgi:hypothetical protein
VAGVSELNCPGSAYVFADADAAFAEDAKVIVSDKKRAVLANRQLLRGIGRAFIDTNIIYSFLQFAVAVLRAENAALCYLDMPQADIEGGAAFSAMTIEAGIGVPG